VTAPHEGYGTVITADWTGARLRLRWEYAINANEEAIRLDPSIPSLAVGNPLPTGTQTGGDGLWAGLEGGVYKLRMGKAAGAAVHWTGEAVELRNSTNTPTITLDNAGNSQFTGIMTIGPSGSIQQGTGVIGTNFTGVRIHQELGRGIFSIYGTSRFVVHDNAGNSVGEIGGYPAGGGMLNAQELSIGSYGPFMRGLSLIADSTAGAMAIVGLRSGGSDCSVLMRCGEGTASQAEIRIESVPESKTTIMAATTDISGSVVAGVDVRLGGGLAIGDTTLDPLTGVLLMKERTAATAATPTDTAQIWVQDVSGTQKLYIKFANGVQRELATA
jgi:hypothetical protein